MKIDKKLLKTIIEEITSKESTIVCTKWFSHD